MRRVPDPGPRGVPSDGRSVEAEGGGSGSGGGRGVGGNGGGDGNGGGGVDGGGGRRRRQTSEAEEEAVGGMPQGLRPRRDRRRVCRRRPGCEEDRDEAPVPSGGDHGESERARERRQSEREDERVSWREGERARRRATEIFFFFLLEEMHWER